jgi:hypothetical protein
MPQISSSRCRRTPTAVAVLVVLASLVLAACGSSSKSSSASTASASATTSTTHRVPGAAAGYFLAFRDCLQKDGITLPKRTPGQRPSPGHGGFLGGAGGPALPKGVTKAQYEAAVRKCRGRGVFPGAIARFSGAARQALAKFATCMRENGVNVPAPNASSKGPIFNSKGLNTSSAKFRAAEAKCSSDLPGVFRGRPGAGGPPGSPPSATG